MLKVSRQDLANNLDASSGHLVLRLRDGTVVEGWVMDIDDDEIEFDYVPSPLYAMATGTDAMAPPTTRIALADIAAWKITPDVWQEVE